MTDSRRPPNPSRPFRSIASQMTVDHHRIAAEATAAELAGDWATAFERHRAVSMWAESRHGGRLKMMAELGDQAPGWLRTRFVSELVRRWESYGQPRRAGRVLQHVLPHLYSDGVPLAAIGCEHPQQVPAWIFARDWVVRQADVYELGGLADLVHHAPAAGAVGTGELVGEWCRSVMGGYRVVGAEGGVLWVDDVRTGRRIEVLDLGLTAQLGPGTHVLGRLVPTTTEPGRLFDWRPLPVPERTARLVADRPDDWLSIVGHEHRVGRLAAGFAHQGDSALVTDLPQHSWGVLLGLGIDDDLPRPPHELAGNALKAALHLDAADVRRHRHAIAELLLDEALDDRTVARWAQPRFAGAWRLLAAGVPSYAARRCDEALWLLDASDDGLAG